MLDSRLQGVYEKLKTREKKYQRYARPSYLIGTSFFLVLVLIVIVSVLIGLFLNPPKELLQIFPLVAFLVYFVLSWASISLLDKKAKVYRLDANERALFYACSTLENIQNYFENERSELKKEYKKNALRSARSLLSTIENRWTFGDFKLANDYFGNSISDFKENISNRIIPHIEEENETVLRSVEATMYNFTQFLLNPSVSWLDSINKSIAEKMDSRPSIEESFLAKSSNFLRAHKVLRHTVITIIIGVISYFVYFLAVYYNLASRDVAFGTAIGLFGILVVGYWQYVKKESA